MHTVIHSIQLSSLCSGSQTIPILSLTCAGKKKHSINPATCLALHLDFVLMPSLWSNLKSQTLQTFDPKHKS
jgi:hypothetical protein